MCNNLQVYLWPHPKMYLMIVLIFNLESFESYMQAKDYTIFNSIRKEPRINFHIKNQHESTKDLAIVNFNFNWLFI